jgi:sRNA-binding protein
MTTSAPDQALSRHQRVYDEAIVLLNLLAETWPDTFKHDGEIPVPLAIGTRDAVIDALDNMAEPHIVVVALKIYATQWSYLHALSQPGAMRVDLAGNVTEPVSKQDAASARDRLTAVLQAHRNRRLEAVSAGKAGLCRNFHLRSFGVCSLSMTNGET